MQRRAAWVRVRLWYFKRGIWLCHPRTPGEYSRAFFASQFPPRISAGLNRKGDRTELQGKAEKYLASASRFPASQALGSKLYFSGLNFSVHKVFIFISFDHVFSSPLLTECHGAQAGLHFDIQALANLILP